MLTFNYLFPLHPYLSFTLFLFPLGHRRRPTIRHIDLTYPSFYLSFTSHLLDYFDYHYPFNDIILSNRPSFSSCSSSILIILHLVCFLFNLFSFRRVALSSIDSTVTLWDLDDLICHSTIQCEYVQFFTFTFTFTLLFVVLSFFIFLSLSVSNYFYHLSDISFPVILFISFLLHINLFLIELTSVE